MPRLKEVSLRETTSDIVRSIYGKIFFDGRDPVEKPGTATGTRGDIWTVMAIVPEIMKWVDDGHILWAQGGLHMGLLALAPARTAYLCGSQFVFSQHCKVLRSQGVPEEKIQAIREWSTSQHFTDPVERLILAYTDDLVSNGGRVSDGLFESMKAHLSEADILTLTFLTLYYLMNSIACRALRLEFDDRADPIVEVPATDPEGLERIWSVWYRGLKQAPNAVTKSTLAATATER